MSRTLAQAVIGAVLAAITLAPGVIAQSKPAGAILVTEANVPQQYVALGAVTSVVHPKSLSPKTPTRDLLDADMRAQAAKLGADAVIQVRYTMRNPGFSSKGSEAIGVAVRFTAAEPAPGSAALVPQPRSELTASVSPSVPPPAAPQVAATTPPTPPAPTVVAPVPRAAPQSFAANRPAGEPAPAATAGVHHATSADMIVLSEQKLEGRRYRELGQVRSEVHQKSLFPKTPTRELLNADLKTRAMKLGADAVIGIEYSMHSALTSQKGNIATGTAVRFE